MRHLFRAGVLLLVVVGFAFIGLRVMPVPAFLEEFGFHSRNTQENEEMWASLPMQYVSSSVCVDCHQEEYNMRQKGNHRTVSCENCHGPARAHLETGASPVVSHSTRELCGLCHAQLVSRPSDFPQVDMAEMGEDKECVICHDPHDPRAGMPAQVPHALERRSDCQLCHDPRAHEPWVEPPPQSPHTLEGRTDCLACHGPTEIRGATLPHPPHSLEGRSDCLLCHSTGGIRPLPLDHVGRKSATCLNCHQRE